jgi:hypothetical protein
MYIKRPGSTTMYQPKAEKEKIYVCEAKKLFLRNGQKQTEWVVMGVADAIKDGVAEFRCKDCRGKVRLHGKHVEYGPASTRSVPRLSGWLSCRMLSSSSWRMTARATSSNLGSCTGRCCSRRRSRWPFRTRRRWQYAIRSGSSRPFGQG